MSLRYRPIFSTSNDALNNFEVLQVHLYAFSMFLMYFFTSWKWNRTKNSKNGLKIFENTRKYYWDPLSYLQTPFNFSFSFWSNRTIRIFPGEEKTVARFNLQHFVLTKKPNIHEIMWNLRNYFGWPKRVSGYFGPYQQMGRITDFNEPIFFCVLVPIVTLKLAFVWSKKTFIADLNVVHFFGAKLFHSILFASSQCFEKAEMMINPKINGLCSVDGWFDLFDTQISLSLIQLMLSVNSRRRKTA